MSGFKVNISNSKLSSFSLKNNPSLIGVDNPLPKVESRDFSNMFYNCRNLLTVPTNLFENNKSVTNMVNTFYYCYKLTTAPNIPNSVTDMRSTFYSCTKLTTAPNIPN